MNKKTIIIIISVIAALAIVIGGTVALLTSKFKDAPNKDNSSQSDITSSEASKPTSSDSVTDSSSNKKPSSNNSDDKNTDNTDTSDELTVSVPKVNTNTTTFIVDNVSTKQGGKVKVPVYVSSNKGFMGVFAKFQYDTSALKYTGYKKGDLLSDYELQEQNGIIKFMSVERGDVTKDGVVLYLEFDVVTASKTKTPIKVTIDDNAIANKSEQYVKVDTIDGSVTIK